jgi:hypothetical protein
MDCVGRSWFLGWLGLAFVPMLGGQGAARDIRLLAFGHPLGGDCGFSCYRRGLDFVLGLSTKLSVFLSERGFVVGLVWLLSGGLWAVVPKVGLSGRLGILSHSSAVLTSQSRRRAARWRN